MSENYYYKLILSYKGTQYSGWQRQTVNPNTIQEVFEKVLSKFVNYQNFQVIAASRTDTGVHALGQVLKIVLPKDIEPNNLVLGLNTKLPQDIRVISCEYIEQDFNVNKNVTSKEYHYYFCKDSIQKGTLTETLLYKNSDLNIDLMQKACSEFVGIHDLINFCVKGSREVNTTREIFECSIEKTSFSPIESEVYYFKIKAKGFLKYSVRLIMGALFNIGEGKSDLENLKKAINVQANEFLHTKAPPQGLHLMKIEYNVQT